MLDDNNTSDSDVGRALEAASHCGHNRVVQILLARAADTVPLAAFDTSLASAVRRWHTDIAEMLLQSDGRPSQVAMVDVADAASRGHVEMLVLLAKYNPNVADNLTWTDVWEAAIVAAAAESSVGQMQVLQWLLDTTGPSIDVVQHAMGTASDDVIRATLRDYLLEQEL
ncbi:Aste57867_4397 [Aphanomyces stellatus]|nr:hypothetical protein As57867_004385 [Aphanomyces stellatus]VFT81509.1 Aste57867_4397 [Aphanomyces stellatus]